MVVGVRSNNYTVTLPLCLATAAGSALIAFHIWKKKSSVSRLNTEIKKHPCVGLKTRISVITREEEWNRILPDILQDLEYFPYLGLDTEWVNRDGRNNATSLLQLATYSGHCALLRLCSFSKIPDNLREILADSSIVKVGVGILDDSNKLLIDHNLDLIGCMDLRHLAVRNGSVPGKLGLKSLAFHYLNVHLNKDWRLSSGNWEANVLSQEQIDYAANDALVAVNILWSLVISQLHHNFFSTIDSYRMSHKDFLSALQEIVDPFVDIRFTSKEWKKPPQKGKDHVSSRLNVKARGNAVRKSPLYHNCQLQAPDGQILCTCDIKKAEWYVKKGIGEIVCQDPLTVRLKFEPSGRPEGKAGEYYLSVKPNICVVCGNEESYLRKNVVPHEYRRYFPAVMKDHQSHDVLLMCVRCHQLSNLHDATLRASLAVQCSAPIGTENDVKLRDNFDLKKVKSAGRALLNAKHKLPESRKEELLQVLRDHYEIDDVTEATIRDASECNFHEINSDYTPHSRAVVQHFLKEGGLIQLEVRWREHFLTTMKPKYLPPLWSVNHQEERLGVKASEKRIDQEQYILATQGADEEIDLEEYRKQKKPQLGINPQLC
eukprot:TRINITY_DN2395_c0_g1_i1.p1 TRINITY_DN2395_c0_g1~~TRINITY_DN2395_c0_g1_i1.p1  ORF type:complete len:602 (+),score=79.45 TRINITY_DN2395_c0_g1_i1:69-1874(+)